MRWDGKPGLQRRGWHHSCAGVRCSSSLTSPTLVPPPGCPLNVLAQMIVQLRGELDQGTGPTQQFSTYFIEISAAVIKRETTSSSGTSENGSNIISKKNIFLSNTSNLLVFKTPCISWHRKLLTQAQPVEPPLMLYHFTQDLDHSRVNKDQTATVQFGQDCLAVVPLMQIRQHLPQGILNLNVSTHRILRHVANRKTRFLFLSLCSWTQSWLDSSSFCTVLL